VTYQATLAAAAARFDKDIASHRMAVQLDHGVHRHLVCRRPGTSEYRFTITTWPGHLAISGDMGDYVFRREADMFPWFGAEEINPGYWAGKLTAIDKNSRPKEYSQTVFRDWVIQDFWERRDQYSPADAAKLWKQIKRDVLGIDSYLIDVTSEEGARYYLNDFISYAAPDFTYEDSWEASWDEYTLHYLWCCHAIVWAIRQYHEQKYELPQSEPDRCTKDRHVIPHRGCILR
jgi:hypothetical protein